MNRARRPIVAGNWKMNTTLPEACDLARALMEPLAALSRVETVLCPPFISLAAVGEVVRGSPVALGAQNCFYEPKGAYTGEISAPMLASLGCRYVIVGHSERRGHFGESDAVVARKVRAVLAEGLTPILCVGESLPQNEAGETERVVGEQVRAALAGLEAAQVARLVIAYEPIWAIGTGRPATAEGANATIGFIRRQVALLHGAEAGHQVRIQYGGSVTEANASDLFSQPEIDGALVGGASLRAAEFAAICRAAEAAPVV